MENYTGFIIKAEQLELPPGFRFHPTDEELIIHYLTKKVADVNFSASAIGEIDMNRVEPWDLPCIAKIGENEWYFFCVRDKKYPTGLRTNRATAGGYWKATGKDKEIFKGKCLVGMKKTLVFYKGRAPKGMKTNWVCKEFRLEGKSSIYNLPQSAQNDWVIAKIFQKSGGEKEQIPSNPPPLMDSPSFIGSTNSSTAAVPEQGRVHCFSTSSQEDMLNCSAFPAASNFVERGTFPNGYSWDEFQSNYEYPESNLVQDQGIFGSLLENYEQDMKQSMETEETRISGSQETSLITTDVNNTEISSVLSNLEMGRNYNLDQEGPSAFGGIQGPDFLWSY